MLICSEDGRWPNMPYQDCTHNDWYCTMTDIASIFCPTRYLKQEFRMWLESIIGTMINLTMSRNPTVNRILFKFSIWKSPVSHIYSNKYFWIKNLVIKKNHSLDSEIIQPCNTAWMVLRLQWSWFTSRSGMSNLNRSETLRNFFISKINIVETENNHFQFISFKLVF